MAIPHWKKFENDVQKYFLKRIETEPMVYHRFYDTASARGFLPAQPGDHLVIYRGLPILIETKSSEKHDSLIRCFSSHVPSEQVGSHRLWLRAGAMTLLSFKGTAGLELWPGEELVEARTNGRRLRASSIISKGDTLEDIFSFIRERGEAT